MAGRGGYKGRAKGGFKKGAKGGYSRGMYNAKAYKFTQRRKAALKRAQAISARKRRITVGVMAVGGVAAVGLTAYLGRNTQVGKNVRSSVADSVMRFHPDRARIANARKAANATHPAAKEAMRMGGAVSPPQAPGVNYPSDIFGAHTPGAEAPGVNTTPKITVLPAEDPSVMRQVLQDESDFRKSAEGSLQKFTDRSGRNLPKGLIKNKTVTPEAMRKALEKHNTEVVKSGGQAMAPQEIDKLINDMIADGSVKTVTRGRRTKTRTNPKATPRTTAPGSAMTQAEIDEALAYTEMPHKPVLGTPGTRGVVKIPGAPLPDFLTVPGLGNAQSPFGTKVEGTNLTPAQKGAMTRARNKAKKAAEAAAADAKPKNSAPNNVTPIFKEASAHVPGMPADWDDKEFRIVVTSMADINNIPYAEAEKIVRRNLAAKADKIK